MEIIGIMNDQRGGKNRNYQRLISLLSILDKVENGVPVNVFGGDMHYPGATHTEHGDINERSNLIKLLRHAVTTYRPEDILIVLEADVCVCVDFVRYIREMEKTVPYPESVRTGYTALDSSVIAFEYAVLSRSRFWFSVPVDEWWGTPCTWMTVAQWSNYYKFLIKYDRYKFRLDTALKDYLKSVNVEFVQILIPNPVLHIGNTSAIFKKGNLSGEGLSHKGRRQTVSFVEDPFAL